jgi:hypothetical protein
VLIVIVLNDQINAERLQGKEYKKEVMFPDEEK